VQFSVPGGVLSHGNPKYANNKPVAYSWFPKEIVPVPREWVLKQGHNLVFFKQHKAVSYGDDPFCQVVSGDIELTWLSRADISRRWRDQRRSWRIWRSSCKRRAGPSSEDSIWPCMSFEYDGIRVDDARSIQGWKRHERWERQGTALSLVRNRVRSRSCMSSSSTDSLRAARIDI
jgi:hypothetical protein